jgi:hypothetical protein
VEYLRRHAGLRQETSPAKQYRIQLHVATNGKLTDDEERANDARIESSG